MLPRPQALARAPTQAEVELAKPAWRAGRLAPSTVCTCKRLDNRHHTAHQASVAPQRHRINMAEALKTELRQLMQQRDALEAEIEERSARLNAPGQPGLRGSLLDKEVGGRHRPTGA